MKGRYKMLLVAVGTIVIICAACWEWKQESTLQYRIATWRERAKIYACPNGSFEVWTCTSLHGTYPSPLQAKLEADAWARGMVEFEESEKAKKAAGPCGKEINP